MQKGRSIIAMLEVAKYSELKGLLESNDLSGAWMPGKKKEEIIEAAVKLIEAAEEGFEPEAETEHDLAAEEGFEPEAETEHDLAAEKHTEDSMEVPVQKEAKEPTKVSNGAIDKTIANLRLNLNQASTPHQRELILAKIQSLESMKK